MMDKSTEAQAKLVASILTDNGHPVTPPDEASLDDVEVERWNVCVEIVRRLEFCKALSLSPPAPTPPYCHFCGKDQAEVRQLFSGPTSHICDECIEMAALIMASRVPSSSKEGGA